MSDQSVLERKLGSYEPQQRWDALRQLAALALPATRESGNVNMHCHSFFSYNADGWSPARIAWAAHRAGLYAAALCDFDVLDGMEEFLQAGELLGLRAAVHLETRVFVGEYAEVEIASPGEPGVTYLMGAGFARALSAGSPQARGLADYRESARARSLALVERVNAHLPTIAVDYDRDVLPLTPLGGATERHLIRAYLNRSEAVLRTPEAIARFWSTLLGSSAEDLRLLLGTPALEELVRSRLAKRGGLGYVQPSVDTFPPVDDFIRWVASCKAVPMIAWLDGTSEGEKEGRALLECLQAKGAVALNIIPDRNWNVANPEDRAVKVANLRAIVEAANALQMPINIGTEMNRSGLPFADDLSGSVLSEFRDSFLRGARIIVGHTLLLRYADISYTTYEGKTAEKNAFFESVGALSPLNRATAAKLQEMGKERAFAAICAAAAAQRWGV